MEQIAEALVLFAFTSWPFVVAGVLAYPIRAAIGEQRLARWLRLDLGDPR